MDRDVTKRAMGQRIRSRREALDLSATELAKRVGITPAYISVIESGDRIPSVSVALRLAEVLGDDQDLYMAWAQARDVKDLPRFLKRMNRLLHFRSDPGMRETLGAEIEAPTMMEPEPRTDMVPVPVLLDGFDPGDDPMNADGVEGTIPLPEQVLPSGVVGPFAYRPGSDAVERVRNEIKSGSLVVLSTRPGPLDAEHIQAVRHEGRVILSRVLERSDSMVLLHDSDSSKVEVVDLDPGEVILDRIAGTVVLVLNFWEGMMDRREEPMVADAADPLENLVNMKIAEVAMPLAMPLRSMSYVAEEPTRLRSTPGRPSKSRTEGEFLIRDCVWTDSYGWRPIQKAEDMDHLDKNPGTKMRFNLIRDGELRYVLEMTPDQWREALGDYYDGDTWRTNGYIVAITKRRKGEYTEEFQERWGKWVRGA